MESTRDVTATAKIGKILGERLQFKEIPAVSVFLKQEQKYHGKVKAVIDSLKKAGIQKRKSSRYHIGTETGTWGIKVMVYYTRQMHDKSA